MRKTLSDWITLKSQRIFTKLPTTSSRGNSYYIGIYCNKSDRYQVRLIETAKLALAHSLANTQLHLRVWLALVKHL